ncbi:hypothetical protein KP509_35G067500 [Ceratopteris richardii]|uniref:Uncharacterized protein n=1 Tax=Ceratopteris richardii TaxID=49495 RepID=A0A8T2QI05_CERRI|nr:hypothetical protein KP509_35G067500 [Ceratopteris richardii]
MYFWGTFGNKRKAVLVDSGATHNFMSPECAASLQLALSKLPEMSVTFAQGRDDNVKIALNVRMTVGEWSAKLDFLVVPLESFDVIVGLSFMDRYMVSLLGKKIDKLLLDMQGNIVVVDCYRTQGKQENGDNPGSNPQEIKAKESTPPTSREELDRQRKGKTPMHQEGASSSSQNKGNKAVNLPSGKLKSVAAVTRAVNKQQTQGPMTAKQVEKAMKQGAQAHLCLIKCNHIDIEEQESNKMKVGDQRVQEVLREFQDVLPSQLPSGLPPLRQVQHRIEVMPGQAPPAKAPYRMNETDLKELKR